MKLNDRIKIARTEAGLNQTELADLLNTSQANVSNIESTPTDIPLTKLLNLAKVSGVDPVWLIFGFIVNYPSDAELTIDRSGISDRIKFARQESGVTQTWLSKKLGCARATIFLWENDRHIPTLPSILKLAELLHVSPVWIVFGIEDTRFTG